MYHPDADHLYRRPGVWCDPQAFDLELFHPALVFYTMSPYPSPDTTMTEVRTEQALIDGTVIGAAAYGELEKSFYDHGHCRSVDILHIGVHLTLFFQCFAILVQRKPYGKNNWSMLAYICVLFTLGTVGFGGQVKFNEMMFVQYRDFPGGPLGFNFGMYNTDSSNMATTSYVSDLWAQLSFPLIALYMQFHYPELACGQSYCRFMLSFFTTSRDVYPSVDPPPLHDLGW